MCLQDKTMQGYFHKPQVAWKVMAYEGDSQLYAALFRAVRVSEAGNRRYALGKWYSKEGINGFHSFEYPGDAETFFEELRTGHVLSQSVEHSWNISSRARCVVLVEVRVKGWIERGTMWRSYGPNFPSLTSTELKLVRVLQEPVRCALT